MSTDTGGTGGQTSPERPAARGRRAVGTRLTTDGDTDGRESRDDGPRGRGTTRRAPFDVRLPVGIALAFLAATLSRAAVLGVQGWAETLDPDALALFGLSEAIAAAVLVGELLALAAYGAGGAGVAYGVLRVGVWAYLRAG